MGWFTPRCPLPQEPKKWIDGRMQWLCEQFGRERLIDGTVVLPDDTFFPDKFDASDLAIRRLFLRVCEHMDIDLYSVEMRIYSEQRQKYLGGGIQIAGDGKGTAGLYEERDKTIIWIEESHRSNPMSLVATMAHELSHAHLLGGGRISPEEEDHELLTDLTTVYFGLGIFSANSVVNEGKWETADGWSGWQISGQGYLGEPMYAYALALYAWARGEARPRWLRHVRPNVRSALKEALRYLVKTDDTSFNPESVPLRSDD